jgi:hypothetical protein
MPSAERKPCSGWGREARIDSTSLAVEGPVRAAQAMMRLGVHCA